jgi:hypothetical protein
MLEMGQGHDHEKPLESIYVHWTPVFRTVTVKSLPYQYFLPVQ